MCSDLGLYLEEKSRKFLTKQTSMTESSGSPDGSILNAPSLQEGGSRIPPPQKTKKTQAAIHVPPSGSPHPGGGFKNTLSSVGKEVGGAFRDYIKVGAVRGLTNVGAKALNKALDHSTLVNVKSGNVLQFVSRVTGQSLQILQAPDGLLVLDSLHGDDHKFHNADFTVVHDKDGYLLLHNDSNYLAIKDGTAQLYAAGSGGLPKPECRFQIREVFMHHQFVTIENVSERGTFVAVLPNGHMKSAVETSSSDQDTHFAIKLICGPYGTVSEKYKEN